MKKFTIFFILSAFISLIGVSQQPYTVTKLDSTIYKVFEAITTDDGGFIIAGNNHYDPESNKRVFIAKINGTGETLWKKNYPGFMNWISSMIKKSDGNYFIAMDGENHKGVLLETNSEGDSISSWTTTALYRDSRLGPIRELPDGSFIVAENIYSTDIEYPPIESNYYHLNSDGSVITQFDALHIETYDIEVISDNEFISAEIGHDGIVKYNTDGGIMNSDTCADVATNYYGQWAINRLNDHRFFGSGRITLSWNPWINKGLISEFDENGNFAYCATDSSTIDIEGVIPISENKFIYHGLKNGIVVGEFAAPNLFIPRVEIDTITSEDYTLLVSEEYIYVFTWSALIKIPLDAVVSNIKEAINSPVKVYPNPAKDYVIFEDQDGTFKNKVLTVTNAYGQKITSFFIENETTYWDIRQIKAGIYFYSFEKDNSRFGGKIIVMR
jgi:hypothetical protein